MPPSDSRYLPFPFIHTSLLHSLHPSLSIRDCIIGRPSVQPEIESFGFKILCPISDCKLFYPSLYLLKFLRINIDENIGRPMLPSISNENAYLNRVVKPIYDLCVEVKGSIMGTTISIEKNNGVGIGNTPSVLSSHCVCIHQEDEAFVSHLWWRLPEVESRARRKEGEVKGGGLLSFIGREARARGGAALAIDWVFMLSKPLPWDRKDFFKERRGSTRDLRRPTGELNPTGFLMMSVLLYTKKNSRKHERSESLGLLQDRGTRIRFLGVCSPGSVDFRPPTGTLFFAMSNAGEVGIKRPYECTIAHDISLENVSRMHELSEAFHAISLRHTCLMSILEQFSKLSSRAGTGAAKDVEDCNISGPIPIYIVEMTELRFLDLSFNKLNGEIPNLDGLTVKICCE
ncbi:ARM repeat protein interacting with ABF2 [Vitis vinifera]|uniref:ARM repeat protein interacting with ABF2 n=1 Tax=Vitis vinifera TaxID=29760 RepID=A0A438GMS7_VITVI|nr:ARM repeat protein interacting with ABF2 [Vitis vinifera]